MADFIPFTRAPSSNFPSDVLKWMKENAKSKMALKLMKCNKYFQHSEFPYFVVRSARYYGDEDVWRLFRLDSELHIHEGLESIQKMFWITQCISVYRLSTSVSNLISKIAVCDIKYLELKNQNILFDEFKFLTSSGTVETLYFLETTIKDENGQRVFIDQFFKLLPNVKDFSIIEHGTDLFSPNFINIVAEINTTKLKRICLAEISYLDYERFSFFMKKNPHIFYELAIHETSVEEIRALEKYVQEIIDNGVTEFPPPCISFYGQDLCQQLTSVFLLEGYIKENERKI
uniref:DUF38 domain-containing protein n=1 Tax=Panagrolaimus sp. ES5 TaxID=591445 RepID=A0AC34FDI6_9BILA